MRAVALLVPLLWMVGCNPPPRPSMKEIGRIDETNFTQSDSVPEVESATARLGFVSLRSMVLPWETWHLYYVGGKKVGYLHTRSKIDTESSEENVRTTIEERILLPQEKSLIVQVLRQTSVESRDGECLSFESELQIGPSLIKTIGRVNFDKLMMEVDRGGRKVSDTAPWAEQVGGAAAVMQTLIAKPIELNEVRRLRFLLPAQNRMAIAELKGVHPASIALTQGRVHKTLEVQAQTGQEDGPLVPSTLWVDSQGQLIKSYTPSTDLIAVLSTQEEAKKLWDSLRGVSLIASIDASGTLSGPEEAYRVGFLLKPRAKTDKSKFTLSPQVGQFFRQLDDGSVQLLVSRDRTETARPGFTGLVSEPLPEDSTASFLVDSGAGPVQQLAGLSKATDARTLALDLARTATQMVVSIDDSPAIVPASQTAKASGGSAGSRAVLLAAMLRARGIPARVVAGLAYRDVAGKAAMGYHVWTLAWIDGAWMPLDATSGKLAPADRIALSSSSLANGNQYELLSPVVDIVLSTDIEIGNAKYQKFP